MAEKNKFETEDWPYMPAKWQGASNPKRGVWWIVIHCMEWAEKPSTAEDCGLWFQICPNPASSHLGIDSDSTVQYVKDSCVAFAAPGANRHGIHIEHAGKSDQNKVQWLDPYGVLMLERSADACAQYCLKYDIPARRVEAKDLKAGHKGICGHWDATKAFPPNNGHTDPGPDFPWDFYLERVRFHVARLKGANK